MAGSFVAGFTMGSRMEAERMGVSSLSLDRSMTHGPKKEEIGFVGLTMVSSENYEFL